MKATPDKVDAFFDSLEDWRDELFALRAILLDTPLTETFKWRSPVYTFDGANVAIVWGFKDRATLGFFKGVLLKDAAGILEAPGKNSRFSRITNFTNTAQITQSEPVLRAYIAEAIRIEQAGIRVEPPDNDLEYPRELTDRIDRDPDFCAAFRALTPGRQRGWVLHFAGAKQSQTRTARIDRAAARILAGKGMQDR